MRDSSAEMAANTTISLVKPADSAYFSAPAITYHMPNFILKTGRALQVPVLVLLLVLFAAARSGASDYPTVTTGVAVSGTGTDWEAAYASAVTLGPFDGLVFTVSFTRPWRFLGFYGMQFGWSPGSMTFLDNGGYEMYWLPGGGLTFWNGLGDPPALTGVQLMDEPNGYLMGHYDGSTPPVLYYQACVLFLKDAWTGELAWGYGEVRSIPLPNVSTRSGLSITTANSPLSLSGAVYNDSTFTVDSDGTLLLTGNTSLFGPGTYLLDGGTITGDPENTILTNKSTFIGWGDIDPQIVNNGSFEVSGGDLISHGGGPDEFTSNYAFTNNGTVLIDAKVAMGGFDGGGSDFAYLQAAGETDVNGTLHWHDGCITVTGGALNIASGGAVLCAQNAPESAFVQVDGETNIEGTLNAGLGYLDIQGGTVHLNGGTITGDPESTVLYNEATVTGNGDIDPQIVNNGSFTVTGGDLTSHGGGNAFTNNGTVAIDAKVALGGMDSTGSDFAYNQGGGETNVNGTLHWHDGSINVTGGSLNVGSGGAVLCSQNAPTSGFVQTGGETNLNGGTLDAGLGYLDIQGGTVHLNGGTITGNPESTVLYNAATVTGNGDIDTQVVNNGSFTVTGGDLVSHGGGTAFTNNGTVAIDAKVAMGGMDSTGSDFAYNQGGGETNVNGTLHWHDGSINVTGGSLNVGSGGAVLCSQNAPTSGFLQTGGETNLNGGTLDAGHGTIQIQGGTVNVGKQASGEQYALGTCDSGGHDFAYNQTGGTVNLNGDAALWNPAVQGGVLNIGPGGSVNPSYQPAVSTAALARAKAKSGAMPALSGAGTAPLTVAYGGTVIDNGLILGDVNVLAEGVLLGSGTVTGDLVNAGTVGGDGGALTIQGTLYQMESATYALGGGALHGQTLCVGTPGTVVTLGGGSAHFGSIQVGNGSSLVNNGTLIVKGSTAIAVAGNGSFINNGVLDLINAPQTLPAGFVNHGTVIRASDLKVKQILLAGSSPQLTIQSYVNHHFQLQRSDSLAAGSWQPIGTVLAGTGGVLTFADPGAAAGGRWFYRIQVTP